MNSCRRIGWLRYGNRVYHAGVDVSTDRASRLGESAGTPPQSPARARTLHGLSRRGHGTSAHKQPVEAFAQRYWATALVACWNTGMPSGATTDCWADASGNG